MGRHIDPEDYRQECIDTMGQVLGEIFYEVDDEFTYACFKWQEHEALFGKEENIALLNGTAPIFFGRLQQSLLDDVVLHIARLTDRAQVARKDTLTLERLKDSLPEGALKMRVAALYDVLFTKLDVIRDLRNNQLAHLNLSQALGTAPPVPEPTRREVKEVLAAVATMLNEIKLEYRGVPTHYDDVIAPPGGVDSLLYFLRKGLDAENAEMEELRVLTASATRQ